MIALLMSSLVLTGCGDDDGDNGPSGGGNSLTIDGNNAPLDTTTVEDTEFNGINFRIINLLSSNGKSFTISISSGESNVDPGDYDVGTATNSQSNVGVSYSDGIDTTAFLVQSGTVTLSTNSADRVEGSFNVEAENVEAEEVSDSVTVSIEGSFALDVP
jgi:hypothetical protein